MGGYISLGDLLFIPLCFKLKLRQLILIALLSYGLSDFFLGAYLYIGFSILIRFIYIFLFFSKNYNFIEIILMLFISQLFSLIIYTSADSLFWKRMFIPIILLYRDFLYNIIQSFIVILITPSLYQRVMKMKINY